MKQTLYKVKEIITMVDNLDQDIANGHRKSNYNAVLIEDDIIQCLGKFDDLKKKYPNAEITNHENHVMMPSFIDPHSHFAGVASSLIQVPLEECYSFEEILQKIRDFVAKQKDDSTWIFAKGYDHNQLLEKRHITKDLLDTVSNNHPLIIIHSSGHNGVFNSKALQQLGIDDHTEAPKGGMIGKENGKLTGFMEENAFIENVMKAPMPDDKILIESIKKAQKIYQSHGITTMHEGMLVETIFPMYRLIVEQKLLQNDLIGYVGFDSLKTFDETFQKAVKDYFNHFKIGGIKMFLDGSPQGRTAWMRSAYADDAHYFAYPTMKYEDILKTIETAYHKNMQIITHVNGDRAIEEYITAIKELHEKYEDIAKLRPVMIHAQFMGLDQLDDVKKYGFIPSYFVAHVYYHGDTHIKNFGRERADYISPLKSSLAKGILFTIHQDSPVIEPDMLESVWIAATRITKNNVALGVSERISVYDALKAVTIHAAYQYFEEGIKGSMEVGKKADLVILDRNPTAVDIDEIKDIRIISTIKDGTLVYSDATLP